MNYGKRLLLAALLAGTAAGANAAVVTFDVVVSSSVLVNPVSGTAVTTTAYNGITGTGFYDFDAPGAPFDSIVFPKNDFGISIDFGAGVEDFDSMDDLFGGALAETDANGEISDLFYTVADDDTFTPNIEDVIAAAGIVDFSIIGVTFGSKGAELVEIEVQYVPLPATLPLMLGGLGLAAAALRRRDA